VIAGERSALLGASLHDAIAAPTSLPVARDYHLSSTQHESIHTNEEKGASRYFLGLNDEFLRISTFYSDRLVIKLYSRYSNFIKYLKICFNKFY
jgi:hypothetical protein